MDANSAGSTMAPSLKTSPKGLKQNDTTTNDIEPGAARDKTAGPTFDGEENITLLPPGSSATSTRGRGRGGSRARGSRRANKPRKRKRSDANDSDDDDSEDSEVIAPTAVMTKSGRSVQRPTSFVPPAVPSPTSTPTNLIRKKQRTWRRNPENAVCKACLRGVSPASNMIVFCDGCNTPYHRWCHHPPIDQSVIDEADKEWYCRQCTRERIVPVPESEMAHFVAGGRASLIERQKFFSSLTPGALVTLLARATTLHPDLPVFDPEWAAKHADVAATAGADGQSQQKHEARQGMTSQNDHATGHQQTPATIYVKHDDEDEDEGYGPEEHPAHYVRPGKGLMSTLPPDKDDATHLVDEENGRRVFHHIFLVDEKAASTPPQS